MNDLALVQEGGNRVVESDFVLVVLDDGLEFDLAVSEIELLKNYQAGDERVVLLQKNLLKLAQVANQSCFRGVEL